MNRRVFASECNDLVTKTRITCPVCGHQATEVMPLDACVIRYRCTGCGAELRPKGKECCVFCSYGDVRCPPVQGLGGVGDRSSCCG